MTATQIIYNISQVEPREVKGIDRFIGLIGTMNEHTRPLLFKFNKPTMQPIHSFFVFISFIATWTFEDGTTQSMLVTPWISNIRPLKPYIQLVERPLILQQDDEHPKL